MSRQVKKVNISGKEDKSNKVTSWSNTTTDTHYPSEKLVKDSLDGKANSTHTHNQYLTEHQDLSNYVTTDDSRLSDARTPTSHTHTKSQITDFPTLPSASSTVPSADTTNGSYGSGTSYARSNHTHPKSSLYAEASHTHSQYLTSHQDISGKEDKSNKVTSISSSSTDMQYPSAKVVYDTIEPKLAKSDTKILDSQYMVYGAYNSWEIVEVFGLQEMANQVIIDEDSIEYMDFEGVLKFTNNTPKRILLNLRLGLGNSSEHYYSFDRENYIDLSSTETTITLESDEFVYLYCDNGNSIVLYSVRSDKNTIGTIVDMIYPVGSIYMNVNPTDPQILFGGTWTRLKDRFLLSSGDTYTNGSTGGEATHTLTTDEMPSHTHIQNSHNHTQNAHSHGGKYDNNSFVMSETTGASNKRVTAVSSGSTYVNTASSSAFHHYNATESVTATNQSATATNQNTGGGQAHNNMPPYLAVYMWKRIA